MILMTLLGGKRASKNIEVTMHVCSEDGKILEVTTSSYCRIVMSTPVPSSKNTFYQWELLV